MRLLCVAVCFLMLFCACASDPVDTQAEGEDGSMQQRQDEPSAADEQPDDGKSAEEVVGLLRDSMYSWGCGRYLLLVGRMRDSDGSIPCRLISTSGDFDQTIDIPAADYVFGLTFTAVGESRFPPEADLYSLDRTATLRVQHHVYHLDFESGTYEYQAQYRQSDLRERLDRSPDGNLSVYLTYFAGLGGESFTGEYVVMDENTREIWRLTSFTYKADVFFVGDDQILVCGWNRIGLYDARTGAKLDQTPAFEFDRSEQDGGAPAQAVIGAAYDPEQDVILIAHRDDEYVSDDLPVRLSVYGAQGDFIRTVDTGYSIYPIFLDSFYNLVEFEFTGDATVNLHTYARVDQGDPDTPGFVETVLGPIRYLESGPAR